MAKITMDGWWFINFGYKIFIKVIIKNLIRYCIYCLIKMIHFACRERESGNSQSEFKFFCTTL